MAALDDLAGANGWRSLCHSSGASPLCPGDDETPAERETTSDIEHHLAMFKVHSYTEPEGS